MDMTPHALTREQEVARAFQRLREDPFRLGVVEIMGMIYDEWTNLSRQANAQQAQEVERLKEKYETATKFIASLGQERDDAAAQLAASQARVRELELDVTHRDRTVQEHIAKQQELQATLAEREATINELINRDARQQEREKNWRECFEEFKDLANGVERKYLQSHAVAIKNSLDTARQDAARLREAALWAMKKVKRLSNRAVDYKRADDFIQHEEALKGA